VSHLPPSTFPAAAPAADDELASLNGEELACLGLLRADRFEFLTHEERSAELFAALSKLDAIPWGKPAAAPDEKGREHGKRKPTLTRLVAKAKQLGVDVTVEPNGAVTFRTGGSASAPIDKPQTELDEWIAKHAY
jgi:hypothetical protein